MIGWLMSCWDDWVAYVMLDDWVAYVMLDDWVTAVKLQVYVGQLILPFTARLFRYE